MSFIEREDYPLKAPLEETDEDHRRMGSSNSSIADVMNNSGKTSAELMTDQQIAAYLVQQRSGLIEFKQLAAERPQFKSTYESFLDGQKRDFDYLKRIGRYQSIRTIMKSIVNSQKS